MAAGERIANVRLGADSSRLDPDLAKARSKLKRFGTGVSSELKGAFKGAFEALGTIGGFAGIAGIAVATKGVLDFEKALSRLGVAMDLPRDELAKLRKEIFEIGTETGVDPDKMLAGVTAFAKRTGDMGLATKSMGELAKVSEATGVDMEKVGVIAGALNKNMGVTAGGFEKAFGILIKGKVDLEQFGQEANDLTETFSHFGKGGVEGLAQMGGLLKQLSAQLGPEAGASGLVQLMELITKHSKELRGKGIKTTEFVNGKEQFRDISDILDDINKKSGGAETKMRDLLGGKHGAIQAARVLIKGGREELEKYTQAGLDNNEVEKRAANAHDQASEAMARVEVQIKKIANAAVSGHIEQIAHGFQLFADAVALAAEHSTAVIALFAAYKATPAILRIAKGLRGGGEGIAGAIGAVEGTPVFVTNWPVGMGGGGGIPGALKGLGTLAEGAGLAEVAGLALAGVGGVAFIAATVVPAALAAMNLNNKMPQIRKEFQDQFEGEQSGRVLAIMRAEDRSGGDQASFMKELGPALMAQIANDPALQKAAWVIHNGYTPDEVGLPTNIRITIDSDANLKARIENSRAHRDGSAQ